jgi:hypothetical protein
MTYPQINTQKMYQELCRRSWPGYPTIDEFLEKVNALSAKDPYPHLAKGRSMWEVMKEYRYDKRTVRNDYEHMIAQHANALDAVKVTAAAGDVMDALNQLVDLPSTAEPALELEWVGGHPAMLRYDMQRDKTVFVMLAKEDVLASPNGPPPSRRAVSRLANWVNRPNKFHEMLLGEDKKAKHVGDDSGAQAEADNDVSLSEVRELLKGLAAK